MLLRFEVCKQAFSRAYCFVLGRSGGLGDLQGAEADGEKTLVVSCEAVHL